jgi:hypothetical protein
MEGLFFPIVGVLGLGAGALSTWWYLKTRRPVLALLAGALYVFAAVVIWRTFSPAGERHPWMK